MSRQQHQRQLGQFERLETTPTALIAKRGLCRQQYQRRATQRQRSPARQPKIQPVDRPPAAPDAPPSPRQPAECPGQRRAATAEARPTGLFGAGSQLQQGDPPAAQQQRQHDQQTNAPRRAYRRQPKQQHRPCQQVGPQHRNGQTVQIETQTTPGQCQRARDPAAIAHTRPAPVTRPNRPDQPQRQQGQRQTQRPAQRAQAGRP